MLGALVRFVSGLSGAQVAAGAAVLVSAGAVTTGAAGIVESRAEPERLVRDGRVDPGAAGPRGAQGRPGLNRTGPSGAPGRPGSD
nr:hypothetical protein [Thermoleophilaceae bacterium]